MNGHVLLDMKSQMGVFIFFDAHMKVVMRELEGAWDFMLLSIIVFTFFLSVRYHLSIIKEDYLHILADLTTILWQHCERNLYIPGWELGPPNCQPSSPWSGPGGMIAKVRSEELPVMIELSAACPIYTQPVRIFQSKTIRRGGMNSCSLRCCVS